MKHQPDPRNPRYITESAFDRLQETMERLGDISGIVFNQRTGQLVGGHQRSKVIDLNLCAIEIVKRFDPPTEDGTVSVGYAYWMGRRFNYRIVDWDEKTAELANLVANKAGGKWDYEALANDFELDLLLEVGFTELELFGVDDALPSTDDSPTEYIVQIKTSEKELDAIEDALSRLDIDYETKKKKAKSKKR